MDRSEKAVVRSFLRGQPGEVTAVVFRPDVAAAPNSRNGRFRPHDHLAVGDNTGLVCIWSLANARPIASFQHLPAQGASPNDATAPPQAANRYRNPHVLSLAFAGRDHIFTQGRDQAVRVWKLQDSRANGATKIDVSGPQYEIRVPLCGFCNILVFRTPTGATCASGHEEEQSSWWCVVPEDGDSRRLLLHRVPLEAHREGPVSDEVDDAAAARIAPLTSLHVESNQKLGMPMSLAVGPANSGGDAEPVVFIVAGYESGHVAVLRLAVARCGSDAVKTSTLAVIRAFADPAVSVAMAADAARVFACSATGVLQCHRPRADVAEESGAGLASADVTTSGTLLWEDSTPVGASTAALHPHGRLLALAAWDGTVRLYDAAHGSRAALLRMHDASVMALAFHPGDRTATVATGSSDRTVALWELPSALLPDTSTAGAAVSSTNRS